MNQQIAASATAIALLAILGLAGPAAAQHPAPEGKPAPSTANMQGDDSVWRTSPYIHAFYDLTVATYRAGSVKVDPSYLTALGNSTTRITVEEQLGKYVTITYATNVDTTAQQLLQAEIAINRHVSLQLTRDESGVVSMVIKAIRRYR